MIPNNVAPYYTLSQNMDCKKRNKQARAEYERIKAHITEISQEVVSKAYKNKAVWKLPPEQRIRICVDIMVKKLCKDFHLSHEAMIEWLLFDYLTEISKIDLTKK